MPDLISVIKIGGLLGLCAIIFAESGLLIGFFLPGDSLIFTAGLLAADGYFNIVLLCACLFVAAVSGDSVGYAFGKKIGPRLFTREESFFFSRNHIERARLFFEKYGRKSIVLARFMPVVRTFVPILAGVGEMEYSSFITYNIVGGALWCIGLPLLGYTLGKSIPNVDAYLLPIVVGIVVLSLLPAVGTFMRKRQ